MPDPEADKLLNHAINAALELLAKHDCIYPFALVNDDNESGRFVTASEQEEALSEEVVALIVKALKKDVRSGKISMVAIVETLGINLDESGLIDAIKIHIEGKKRPVVVCYLPYKRSKRKVVEGEPVFTSAESRFF